MVSNSLSKRRGFKPRPDVCKSLPNPGRCHPPDPPEPPAPECDCTIVQDAAPWEQGSENFVTLHAFRADLDEESPVDIVATSDGDQPLAVNETRDNGFTEEFAHDTSDDDDNILVVADFTFADAFVCHREAIMTVESGDD